MDIIERPFVITVDSTGSLNRWTRLLTAWDASLQAIAGEVGEEHVGEIRLDDLTSGSILTEVTITFDQKETADAFTRSHDRFGLSLRDGTLADLPPALQRAGERLLEFAGAGDSGDLMLSSDTGDFLISPGKSRDDAQFGTARRMRSEAHGTVTGRLQSLSSRGSLRVVLFDDLHHRAVRCFIHPAQQSEVAALWDQRVEVRGLINRDPVHGRPLSVRRIDAIVPVGPAVTPSMRWMEARGALADVYPDLRSEEIIRMMRDG